MDLTKTNTFLRLSTNSYHKQTKNIKKTKGPNCIGNVKKGKRVQNAAFNWRLLQSSSRFFSFILHLFRVFFFTLSLQLRFSLSNLWWALSLSLSIFLLFVNLLFVLIRWFLNLDCFIDEFVNLSCKDLIFMIWFIFFNLNSFNSSFWSFLLDYC